MKDTKVTKIKKCLHNLEYLRHKRIELTKEPFNRVEISFSGGSSRHFPFSFESQELVIRLLPVIRDFLALEEAKTLNEYHELVKEND